MWITGLDNLADFLLTGSAIKARKINQFAGDENSPSRLY
jgi:hypothetical protein